MSIICLIGARGGSKSIPDKNIRLLGQHPLIAYSIAAGKMSQYVQDVVVSTDSEKIADVAKQYGASVPVLRPAEYAQDNSLDIDYFQHYLQFLKSNGQEIPDLILHLRPTTPLRDVAVIDQALAYMMEHTQATALRSMHESVMSPYKMFKQGEEFAEALMPDPNQKESYNLSRQAFEPTYSPNGYVDVVRSEVVLETGMFHGPRIKLWETERVPDIDTLDDFEYAHRKFEDQRYQPLIAYLAGLPAGREV